MALFIKQYSLENKKAQIIPQITDFGYIAWKFLLAIYQSSWDKFIANKDNKTFRQCIFTQFNKIPSNKKTLSNLNKDKDKQADISRVPPSILLRSSKSILTKLKYFKKIHQLTQTYRTINSYILRYLKVI